jgi:glycerol-3-phosphate dehydrogenase (NAD(P)+)
MQRRDMSTVVILGSGIMGTALAFPLADNGHEVRLVGTHLDREIIDSIKSSGLHPGLMLRVPESVQAFQLEDAEDAFAGADIAMSGVNSFGVRWAGEHLARLLTPDMILITIAKGLEASEDGDLRILPDVLTSEWPEQLRRDVPVSAIVGPSIAGEVAVRHDTCVVFAGPDQAVVDRLAATFRTDRYHVWTSTDLVGCEVCAAAKNCYALGVGLAEGVRELRGASESPYRMHNYEAALFAQGAIEMARLVDLLGGLPETATGLPAVGDMYVTSAGGRNVRVGRLLGAGVPFTEAWARLDHITLEGAAAIRVIGGALPKLTERGLVGADEFPLLRHLHEVIVDEKPVDLPWSKFWGGEPGPPAGVHGVHPQGALADPALGAD